MGALIDGAVRPGPGTLHADAALAPVSFATGFLALPALPALLDLLGLQGGGEVLPDPPVVPAKPVPWV